MITNDFQDEEADDDTVIMIPLKSFVTHNDAQFAHVRSLCVCLAVSGYSTSAVTLPRYPRPSRVSAAFR